MPELGLSTAAPPLTDPKIYLQMIWIHLWYNRFMYQPVEPVDVQTWPVLCATRSAIPPGGQVLMAQLVNEWVTQGLVAVEADQAER